MRAVRNVCFAILAVLWFAMGNATQASGSESCLVNIGGLACRGLCPDCELAGGAQTACEQGNDCSQICAEAGGDDECADMYCSGGQDCPSGQDIGGDCYFSFGYCLCGYC